MRSVTQFHAIVTHIRHGVMHHYLNLAPVSQNLSFYSRHLTSVMDRSMVWQVPIPQSDPNISLLQKESPGHQLPMRRSPTELDWTLWTLNRTNPNSSTTIENKKKATPPSDAQAAWTVKLVWVRRMPWAAARDPGHPENCLDETGHAKNEAP